MNSDLAPSTLLRTPAEARLSCSTPADSTSRWSSAARFEREPHHVVGDGRTAPSATELHATRIANIGGDLLGVVGDAPALEQLLHLAGVGRHAGHAHHRVGAGGHFGHGIDEHQHLAATQRELVDGVGGLGGEPLRLHQHENVDVGRDFLDVVFERLDLEELADLVHHQLRRGRLRAHAHHGRHGAIERNAADHANHTLLGIGQRVDQLGHIVLEEALTLRREEADAGLVVGGVGADQAEVALVALAIERDAPQARRHGAILGVGERLGVEEADLQLAAGDVAIALQQRTHALEILGVGRGGIAQGLREINAHVDRLVDGLERLARAVGDREQAVAGEVHLDAAEGRRGEQVDGQEGDGGQRQAAPGQLVRVEARGGLGGAFEMGLGGAEDLIDGRMHLGEPLTRLCAGRG